MPKIYPISWRQSYKCAAGYSDLGHGYCVASLRAPIAGRLCGSNFNTGVWRDPHLSTSMKLRLHRKYSIKLMLAWGTCCRFPSSSSCQRSSADNSFYILFRSALGSGILFSYPEISTIAGVQGLVVYTLSSSLPLLVFGFLGPVIRRKCPEGFVLTEWTRQRYGIVTALYLSLLTYAHIPVIAPALNY